jgi:hypothetical protein
MAYPIVRNEGQTDIPLATLTWIKQHHNAEVTFAEIKPIIKGFIKEDEKNNQTYLAEQQAVIDAEEAEADRLRAEAIVRAQQ